MDCHSDCINDVKFLAYLRAEGFMAAKSIPKYADECCLQEDFETMK